MLLKEKIFGISRAAFSLTVVLLFGLSTAAFAQTDAVAQNQTEKSTVQEIETKTVPQPAVTELRGITIGMTAEEVKDKLGKAETADATGFYYVFSDEESMQITLDADKKVRMLATIYLGNETIAPKYEDVFGANAEIEKQADGKIYNLVRYPNAGYWVAYNRLMVGDEPMITVTMQKMNQTGDSNETSR